MKTLHISTNTVVILSIIAAFGLTLAQGDESKKEHLKARAKVTKSEAEKTALTKVPEGTIKEAELEEENGKLVWSFDISSAGTKDITEVQVDALNGKIVSVQVEKPADEAKEARKEKDAAKRKWIRNLR
jgi:hypothetical protein